MIDDDAIELFELELNNELLEDELGSWELEEESVIEDDEA
jgi:hypothetical protein